MRVRMYALWKNSMYISIVSFAVRALLLLLQKGTYLCVSLPLSLARIWTNPGKKHHQMKPNALKLRLLNGEKGSNGNSNKKRQTRIVQFSMRMYTSKNLHTSLDEHIFFYFIITIIIFIGCCCCRLQSSLSLCFFVALNVCEDAYNDDIFSRLSYPRTSHACALMEDILRKRIRNFYTLWWNHSIYQNHIERLVTNAGDKQKLNE